MEYIIEMLNITKRFPGITANDGITLQLAKAEIHALLGENGAGKSTLMSVLFGLYQPEEGEIKKDGRTVRINNPREANDLGIGMVHQHFKLVENFTVLENIILGTETVKLGNVLVMDEARKKVMALSERYRLSVDPDALISDITVGMQQRVEILKMLYRENEILIFDEPTAVLTPSEIRELIQIMKNLRDEGKSILFITHKLDEIKEAAGRCTVLRKGKLVGTVDVEGASKEELSRMMVGRDVNLVLQKEANTPGDVVLSVKNLSVKSPSTQKNLVDNVSFDVRKGEIVCIAGIDGNGQSELVYAVTGLMRTSGGRISISGTDVTGAPVRKRYEKGLALSHIPEDRHKFGLVLDYDLAENLVLQTYNNKNFSANGFLRFNKIYENADMLISKFDIRSGQGAKTTVRSMSGGNQQKAIIARELERSPAILVAVQPTRGLDVGAVEYIHKTLVAERNKGTAILLVSLELDEVMNLSDRILVISKGQLVAELDPRSVSMEELGLYMSGTKRQEAYA